MIVCKEWKEEDCRKKPRIIERKGERSGMTEKEMKKPEQATT
jgi:hypothetical protein